jgi:hypothetical protein
MLRIPLTETKEFSPEEGYAFLNRWTLHTESYETRFADRKVTKVHIQISKGRPVSASVSYQRGESVGFETINLDLRETPISEQDFAFMQRLAQTEAR